MIPEDFIESWRQHVPWQTLSTIEQDLVISKALVCLYSDPKVRDSLVFRGGTALNLSFKIRSPWHTNGALFSGAIWFRPT